MRIVNETRDGIGQVIIHLDETDGEQFRRIMTVELPSALNRFSSKNREYGDNAGVLGARGQFGDIWRKVGKLRTALWLGKPERLTSESVEEVLHDMIGHLLLTLDMYDPNNLNGEL